MTFKFAFIAVLCVVQANPTPARNYYDKTELQTQTLEMRLAEEIPLELEETLQNIDDVRETVSMAGMEAYVEGNNPEVIIACFKQQRGPYMKLGRKIAGMIRESSNKMAEELGENYQKYAKRATVPLKTIGTTMRELPQKMWMFIKDRQFRKAFEVMRESRKIVEENSKILAQIMRDMSEEVPESAKKAEEMIREIREVSRKGSKEIDEAFRKCVEEGGPKKPVGNVNPETEDTLEI